eukprot:45146-Prymnesium_polylepis.1
MRQLHLSCRLLDEQRCSKRCHVRDAHGWAHAQRERRATEITGQMIHSGSTSILFLNRPSIAGSKNFPPWAVDSARPWPVPAECPDMWPAPGAGPAPDVPQA